MGGGRDGWVGVALIVTLIVVGTNFLVAKQNHLSSPQFLSQLAPDGENYPTLPSVLDKGLTTAEERENKIPFDCGKVNYIIVEHHVEGN